MPDVELVLLVRDGRRSPARRRVDREVLRNDCFDRLREELGDDGFARRCEQVQVVPATSAPTGSAWTTTAAPRWRSCDVVIHSAATVAFDSPLDRAVEVNLLGPVRIAELLGELGVAPHLVCVSTCYVAGQPTRLGARGTGRGQPVRRRARLARRGGRGPALASATSTPRAGSPNAWPSSPPAHVPSWAPPADRSCRSAPSGIRQDWVHDRMVESGRARAASVGWPDAYAFTKALGEIAVTRTVRSMGDDGPRLSIVRPSIIESAARRAAARLDPRLPDGRADHPVLRPRPAARVPRRARGRRRRHPRRPRRRGDHRDRRVGPPATDDDRPAAHIVQVATGDVNPLRYQRLVDRVREWFTEHPLYDEHGQPIVVPDWNFPGRGRVEGQLDRATFVLRVAERVVASVPVRGRAAEWGAQLEERRGQLDRAQHLRRAVRRVHRVRGRVRGRPPAGAARLARRGRRGAADARSRR